MSADRNEMRQLELADDRVVLERLQARNRVSEFDRAKAGQQAVKWVEAIRAKGNSSLMDVFMAEYGLSNQEGIALMCLAEALLRVPDNSTIDALIEDKIAPSDWAAHLGRSSSPLVNASTWALLLTGRVLDDNKPVANVLRGTIKRIGEPMIRQAVKRAMRELGTQFVLGQNIDEAISNGHAARQAGFLYSYDMLGEAAVTAKDALGFFDAYAGAIRQIANHADRPEIRDNPGISIKLSALYERYEEAQRDRVLEILAPRVLILAQMAKEANIGLNIDAEEAARLELSMDVIEAVLSDPSLAGWDGFGIVVQAYGKRARPVIDWFYALAQRLDRKLMLRLVKGAYWDTEIKLAQTQGLVGFPVFISKAATDISYIENAAHLLDLRDRIFPQFATHNAHSVAMIHQLAGGADGYEFQRLHGMGEALYSQVMAETGSACRIYAPVGVHEDLLAYLVRRLLENGANSSFVNQLLDVATPADEVVADPYLEWNDGMDTRIQMPEALFGTRKNSRGFDLSNRADVMVIEDARKPHMDKFWHAAPITIQPSEMTEVITVEYPADQSQIGEVIHASRNDAKNAIINANIWEVSVDERAKILRRAADLYEANFGEVFALLCREAGKTQADAISELREAVDFLRYYADQAVLYANASPRGIVGCISPWNFPLAIFTGQIAAALAAGNAVIAKPAEATPLVAARAVEWLHQAGVPSDVLQFLPGEGGVIGHELAESAEISGICFTGSTATAQKINQTMAMNGRKDSFFIAETGGLNAMIVDSTALPEQAVRDIVISAFQSAGQRCSACRVLFVQEEVADRTLQMLAGAMDALVMGDPKMLATDVGPVIDQNAQLHISEWIEQQKKRGNLRKTLRPNEQGYFVAPSLIELDSIAEYPNEIFGPVLHVIRYRADDLDQVINAINETGYGLTFGMHTRIDDRIQQVCAGVKAGNIYINRNQIGAVVGSQPFGGEGLSGTGPKAGGPLYLPRFFMDAEISKLPMRAELPGPTGESNLWQRFPRGRMICAGPGEANAQAQAALCAELGIVAKMFPHCTDEDIFQEDDCAGVLYWGEEPAKFRQALSKRKGAIVPLITAQNDHGQFWGERHICVDRTASGGNAELLGGV